MANLFNNVQPGDLITSQAWNQVLQTLNSFNNRISALESEGAVANGVVISSVNPSGPVQVGATLQIIGSNFGFTIGATQVTFNGVSVSSFQAGSSDTQLVVTVPNINPPQGGALATLTVANQINSASVPILVLPLPQPVIGIVSIAPGQPSPLPISTGNTDFPFVLTSNANLPATYTATATITGPPWQSLIQLLNSSKGPLTNSQVPLIPYQPVTIYVRIAVPTGTTGTALSLGLAVASGQQSGGTSGGSSYTVGQTPTPPDATIGLIFGSSNPPIAVSGQSITVAQGANATVTFISTYTVPGAYTISATLIQAANWQVAIIQPAPASPPAAQFVLTVTADQIPSGGNFTQNLIFALAPGTGAANGQVQFTIQNKGVTGNQTTTYALTV